MKQIDSFFSQLVSTAKSLVNNNSQLANSLNWYVETIFSDESSQVESSMAFIDFTKCVFPGINKEQIADYATDSFKIAVLIKSLLDEFPELSVKFATTDEDTARSYAQWFVDQLTEHQGHIEGFDLDKREYVIDGEPKPVYFGYFSEELQTSVQGVA